MISGAVKQGRASYEYFFFLATQIFDYKLPICPINGRRILFLNYLCFLIGRKLPQLVKVTGYQLRIRKIENVQNLRELKQELFNFAAFIATQFVETDIDNDMTTWQKKVGKDTAKKVCMLIENYCNSFTANDDKVQGSAYGDNEYLEILEMDLGKVNTATSFEFIRKLYQKSDLPLDEELIFEIYYENNKSIQAKGTIGLEIGSIETLLFHAVLFCFKNNTCPICATHSSSLDIMCSLA